MKLLFGRAQGLTDFRAQSAVDLCIRCIDTIDFSIQMGTSADSDIANTA